MWEFHCDTCGKAFPVEEVELKENEYESDWEYFHIACGSKVESRLKL